MQKQFSLSIIMPVYNTPEIYLRKAINSIINQTFKNIELILVNDGSNHNIEELCKEYKNNDSRIRLINQENKGVASARNAGIDLAKSENIMFVDSDDWIEENTCEILNNYINLLKEEYDVIIFNCYVEYGKISKENVFYPKEGKLNKKDVKELQLQNIEKGITKYYPPECNISVPWCKIYNKKFINENNIRFQEDMKILEDAIFNMNIFEKATNFFVLNKKLYHYRKNRNSIMNRYFEKIDEQYETYFRYVDKYISTYKKEKEFLDTLNIKILTSISIYMNNYYFNKNNLERYIERKKKFKEKIVEKLYINAFENVKLECLNKYQRLILRNVKKQNILMLVILNKIKNAINKIKEQL